jgi:galactokinase
VTVPGAVERVRAAVGTQARWFRAPGRVNLMGDHTDYNEGLVLPIAIDRFCVVASRAGGAATAVRSLDEDAAAGDWRRYVNAVEAALARRGRQPVAIEATLASDVPLGSGLSSSAALEVGCALALCDAADFSLAPTELAEACREAEEAATGVPCGIMDQLASVSGREGHALLIDCRSLEATTVRLPSRLGVLVVHSGMPRRLEHSAYTERRRACHETAARLGLRALRDATPDQVAGDAFARHVVAENARVVAAADAIAAGDEAELGRLFAESHASLRDDFRVSTPELDALVEELVAAGAAGARLTGAGFGGCVVAAVDGDGLGRVSDAATAAYRARTGLEPQAFAVRAVDGAGAFEP